MHASTYPSPDGSSLRNLLKKNHWMDIGKNITCKDKQKQKFKSKQDCILCIQPFILFTLHSMHQHFTIFSHCILCIQRFTLFMLHSMHTVLHTFHTAFYVPSTSHFSRCILCIHFTVLKQFSIHLPVLHSPKESCVTSLSPPLDSGEK